MNISPINASSPAVNPTFIKGGNTVELNKPVTQAEKPEKNLDHGQELKTDKSAERAAALNKDVVSVSEDGDTVEVDKAAAELSAGGIVIDKGNKNEAVTGAEDEEKADEAGKVAEVNAADESAAADESKAEMLRRANEERAERRSEIREEIKENEEDREAAEVSMTGLSDSKLEQMYRDGIVSKQDYDKAVEAKESEIGAKQDENEAFSKDMMNGVKAAKENEETEAMINGAFGPDSKDSKLQKEWVEGMMNVEQAEQNAREGSVEVQIQVATGN
ncbi:MAG: hypothetical protein J6N47_00425 [Lachnospiraceae bacterium]|nr:hypothetical protein [Lachnospiraceae bacterium]